MFSKGSLPSRAQFPGSLDLGEKRDSSDLSRSLSTPSCLGFWDALGPKWGACFPPGCPPPRLLSLQLSNLLCWRAVVWPTARGSHLAFTPPACLCPVVAIFKACQQQMQQRGGGWVHGLSGPRVLGVCPFLPGPVRPCEEESTGHCGRGMTE